MDRPATSQTSGPSAIAFEALGAGAVVTIMPHALAPLVRQILPPGARERDARAGDPEFAIRGAGGDDCRVVGPGGEERIASADQKAALECLRITLSEHVALQAPEHLFVRAGAVVMGGRAILLPGGPGSGKSTLVAALTRAGATYYADEYVPIDGSGRVHPYPSRRDAMSGEVGVAPAPVAMIASVSYREGAGLRLFDRPGGDGTLMLLHHARGPNQRPEFALHAARGAARGALTLEGERDDAEAAAAGLIEHLARLPRAGPEQRPVLTPATQFVSLVLELEGELVQLARTLGDAGVDAILLNGDDVRSALAHGFAFAFAAIVEIPLAQVPRALGAMESAGWRRLGGEGEPNYVRRGVVVGLRPRRPRIPRARPNLRGPIAKGRFGLAEPEANIASGQPTGSLRPMPIDPGGALRTGSLGAALQYAAEALTVLDTLRLRTRERDFHGLPLQHGPGVFSVEAVTEKHVDAILAGLPKDGANVRFVEVGTATGAVALSVAKARPGADILATDVSLRALGWARRNRRRVGVHNVRLVQGSLLAPVPAAWRGGVTAVAANLPLALPADGIELRADHGWPIGTATGPGADGLGLVRALARDARKVLAPGGHLHLQLLGQQGPWMAPYLDELGYEAEMPIDASQRGTIEVTSRWPGRWHK